MSRVEREPFRNPTLWGAVQRALAGTEHAWGGHVLVGVEQGMPGDGCTAHCSCGAVVEVSGTVFHSVVRDELAAAALAERLAPQ